MLLDPGEARIHDFFDAPQFFGEVGIHIREAGIHVAAQIRNASVDV